MPVEQAIQTALGHLAAGRLAEAESIARIVLNASPTSPAAYEVLGLAAHLAGRNEEAVAHLTQATLLAPDAARYHDTLSVALTALGRLAQAEQSARTALAIDPAKAAAWINLGVALQFQGRFAEAADAAQKATQLAPGDPKPWANLGAALQSLCRIEEAIAACRQAAMLDPSSPSAHFNLAGTLHSVELLPEAEAEYRKTLSLDPAHLGAWNNLGLVLQRQDRVAEAETVFRRLLQLAPDAANARQNLAGVLQRQARNEEAQAEYQRLIASAPNPAAHSNYLYFQLFLPGSGLSELAAAHEEWDRRYAAPLSAAWSPHLNRRDPEKRLRLGLVSSDFSKHPVGRLILRGVEALDRSRCEVFCYMTSLYHDGYTDRFAATADTWRDVQPLSDDALAGQIRADGIDFLFDLSGHTNCNRLMVFARKPAPIQIAWAGYPSTTGMAAMDFLLADQHQVPPGTEQFYREKIIRLSQSCVTFEPPADGPGVGPLPFRRQGAITLGSTNNTAKISPDALAAWAEILRRVPGSRLLVSYGATGDPALQQRFAQRFSAHGVAADRLLWVAGGQFPAFLEVYNQIDLLLDTFPYSGGITTCESLWMGVPVVTFPGATYASRHSYGHLSVVGLADFIAPERQAYVELAVRMAGDPAYLEETRLGLRRRVEQSPLCDGKRLADSLLSELRVLWREYCRLPV